MGLLDDLEAAASGQGSQSGQDSGQTATGGALGAIMGALQSHPGGLGGLLQSFQQAGLGGLANSWVSDGPNQPVSPGQVQSTLGGSLVGQVASRLGVPPDMAANAISQYLPQIVDHLTPGGQVQQDGAGGLGAIGGLLSRFGLGGQPAANG